MTLRWLLVAALVGALGGVAIAPTQASAAYPRCDHFYDFGVPPDGILRVRVPTVSQSNHDVNCVLALNNNTWGVWALQYALNKCHHAGLPEDAVYRTSTYNVVGFLQTVAKIEVDGVYGPETRRHALKFPIIRPDTGAYIGTCGRVVV